MCVFCQDIEEAREHEDIGNSNTKMSQCHAYCCDIGNRRAEDDLNSLYVCKWNSGLCDRNNRHYTKRSSNIREKREGYSRPNIVASANGTRLAATNFTAEDERHVRTQERKNYNAIHSKIVTIWLPLRWRSERNGCMMALC